MKIWERYGPVELPFVLFGKSIRRIAEMARLIYWRHMFGWDIGKNVHVCWSVHMSRKATVRLGNNVTIGPETIVAGERSGGLLDIGANTNIARQCLLDITGELRIGANTTVSEGVNIYTHSHGRDPKSRSRAHAVSIGDGVWIGVRSIILSSARTIGDKAIIGALEVVRSPIAENDLFNERSKADKSA